MSEWKKILEEIASDISDAAGVSVSVDDLMTPPDEALGDIAFPCFKLAKEWGKNPGEIALALATKMKTGKSGIQLAKAEGPYLNITLNGGDVTARILESVEKEGKAFGQSHSGKDRELMLEYAQPNTHKEIHIGHLRNLVLGSSLHRILHATGWKVISASYHGDVGAHVAKCLWLLTEEGGLDAIPESYRIGKTLGDLYARATALIEEKPELKERVSEVQQKLEAEDPTLTALWEETRSWSLHDMDDIFEELGVETERRYFESEVEKTGQGIVDELLEKDIAQESEGAVIVDLETKKLGILVIRKSDGTSLYATKDLALAKLKFEEYPDIERSLHIVDNRQEYYFKQLFEVFRQMGFEAPMEFIGYDFVTLTSGAMSSRTGNIVTYHDFREEMLKHVRDETVKRHPEWSQDRVQKTAYAILYAGVKFGMLRQSRDKVYTFDPHLALSFEGETGPYIQYAATRLGSILKKAEWTGEREGDLRHLDHPSEKRLAITIGRFPLLVEKAAEKMEPAVLAQWCIEMAHRINVFYRDVSVLDSRKEERAARLRLVACAQKALLSGLHLLGIPVPQEM